MAHIIRKSGSMIAIRRFHTQVDRIVCNRLRLNFSNLRCVKKSSIILNQNLLRKCKVGFFRTKTSTGKLKSITTSIEYEGIAEETLQSIGDRFEELLEDSELSDWDVNYSNDVLTVSLDKHGVYVINKQSPNKQIWLSSPFSGPKRYDYIDGVWIYKHDGRSLHRLLREEMTHVVQKDASFMKCTFGSE